MTTLTEQAGHLIDKSLNVCMTLIRQRRLAEAESILKQALKIDPDNTVVLNLLGFVQTDQENEEEVIGFLQHALKVKPDCSLTHNNISTCFAKRGDFDKAIEHAKRAIEIDPNDAILWNTLGIQQKKGANFEEAIRCFKRSLELDEDPYVMVNLGQTYADTLNFEEAIFWNKKALEIQPGISGAHISIAYSMHAQGLWNETSWRHYEHRLFHFAQLIAYMSIMKEERKWDGVADLKGKRVAAFCEQGHGDAIQFVRYLKELKKLDCHVILNCSKPLARLFKNVEGVDEIYLKDDVFEGKDLDCDYHVPLMSLPLFLKLYDNPLKTPYLNIENKFKFDYPGKLKVGIAWKGSLLHPHDRYRSCPLEYFKRLSIPGVQLISLQMDPCDDPDIIDMSRHIGDFYDTAEIVNGLDLIITVDTSSLHLGGAMGKPVWGLLAHRPDFRWQVDKTDTMWYSSVRLFRQEKVYDWESVFCKVIPALYDFVKQNGNRK